MSPPFVLLLAALALLMAGDVALAAPTTTPTPAPAPTRSPTPGIDAEIFVCFSEDTTVQVQGLETSVKMHDLSIGDSILTQSGRYSQVYAFGHANRHKYAEFIQIFTSDDSEVPLEMTAEHMIYLQDKVNPVRADSVKVGTSLQGSNGKAMKVTTLDRVRKYGVYAPFTTEGNIVVNGKFVASSYISFQDHADEFVELQQGRFATPLSQQTFAHMVSAPFRILCGASSDFCNRSNEDGMPYYVAYGLDLTMWVHAQTNVVVQVLLLMVQLGLAGAFYAVESAFGFASLMTLGVAGYYAVKKQKAKVA